MLDLEKPLDAIPPKADIRRRLARALRETEILRRLLKIRERVEVFSLADRPIDTVRAGQAHQAVEVRGNG